MILEKKLEFSLKRWHRFQKRKLPTHSPTSVVEESPICLIGCFGI